MNRAEFNFLVETGQINLAAAYAILMDNNECVLLRSFEDIVYLTRRIKIAEEIIKNEKASELKKKIEDRINWHKSTIRSVIEVRVPVYASILTAERAQYEYTKDFYSRVVKVFESEHEFEDFYEWIFAIENMS